MKRDLKINYGVLDTMCSELTGYLQNLSQMKLAVGNINGIIHNSSGESIEALKESYQSTVDAIDAFYERISELKTLVYDYTVEMTREIQPISRGAMTRADSNDTYFKISFIDAFVPKYYSWSVLEEESDRWKMSRLTTQADSFRKTVQDLTARLWDIHEKVARYEDTDDEFATRANALYAKYTDGFTRAWEGITWFFGGAGPLVKGAYDACIGIALSIYSFIGLVATTVPYHVTKYLGRTL